MIAAITRAVSPAIGRCELAYLERQPIDFALACEQHRAYCQALRELGAEVVCLPALPDLPDSVFVEDPAVVLDEVAVIARMGAESRRGEAGSLAEALAPFRPLHWLREPATLEGGDVLRIGRKLFVGRSQRTNGEGIAQLAAAVGPFGYTVQSVEIRDCLHLKSGCCYLGEGAILANRAWVAVAPFAGLRIIDVEEPWSADVLRLGGTILLPAAYPRTGRLLESCGFAVRTVDVSELMKAEAGVTCMSLILEDRAG